ncbi:hypothetical protein ACFV0B_21965 [Streptomyces xanthophaeus]|uniref:hypothetical protein n=1 Tax=Streptomyces xanthophaeus TaxID=67385 RepID=UPI0036ACAEEB
MSTPPSPDHMPPPPAQPAYNHPAQPLAPKSVTITFPVIRGKLAAFLYLVTLVLVGVIAWAQVDQALTARDEYVYFRHQMCSGTVYGADEYDSGDRAEYEELCGHPPRTDDK